MPNDDIQRIRTAVRNGVLDEGAVQDAMQREMTTLDNPGFCLECGNEQDGCEPDARNHWCEVCGKHAVFGAAEIMLVL